MKYDFILDINNENSLSLIINNIKPNSQILELGPAHGRMTKYLKEQLNCKVYIVEIDKYAGLQASKYAKDFFIGDIEKFEWIEKFNGIEYDYIILADVLEHLYYPENTVKKCADLLKEGGSIFVSIPNIAHNAIIIDLMKNEFNYKEIGLLDNTHIRFFTYNSILSLFEKSDLVPVKQFATYSKVGETEFNNSYGDICKDFALSLKNKDYGEVYQFVIESKKRNYVEKNKIDCVNNIKKTNDYYFAQLFVDDGESGFKEESSIRIPINRDSVFIEFDLKRFGEIKQLRLDIMNAAGIVSIDEIYFLNDENVTEKAFIIGHNAKYQENSLYIFDSSDPQIYINNPCGRAIKLYAKFRIYSMDINLCNEERYLSDIIESKNYRIQELKESNNDLYEDINKKKEIINKLNEYNREKEDIINKLNECNKEKEQTIEQLTELIEGKTAEISRKDALINELLSSTSWKVTKPLRVIGAFFLKIKKGWKNENDN